MKEKFCSEESELRDVDEEDAAGFAYGNARGLLRDRSPCERGLGEGDTRECATAEGEGGRRSVMPSLCSDVKEGIYNSMSTENSGRAKSE